MTDTYRHFKSTKDEEIEDLKKTIHFLDIKIENLERQIKDMKWEKMKTVFRMIFWGAGILFCLWALGWFFTGCQENMRAEEIRVRATCIRICDAVDMEVMDCDRPHHAVNCISDGHFQRFEF